MNVLNIFSEKIEEILANKDVNTILIIGSGSNVSKDELYKVRDIDLLVVMERNIEFEREVVNHRGVEFDISYIHMGELKRALEEGINFLVAALNKYRFVYKKDEKIDSLLNYAHELYIKGPNKDKGNEINKDYIRFILYQQLHELMIRKNDEINLEFLANDFFKKVLIAYYKLNNLWIPKEKKIIEDIMKRDRTLYDKGVFFLKSNDAFTRLEILEDMVKYILKPFGGVLKEWEKGPFPLKN